jgi:hypothetical protein
MPSSRIRPLVTLLALCGISCDVANAATWTIEVVDPAVAGAFSSLRIDSHGNAHVSYVDQVNHLLRYGFWDHVSDRWFTDTLDKSAGFCSLALDSSDLPHISYLDYGSGRLKYAHWNGKAWQKTAIPINAKVIDYYTSIGLDQEDSPRISYYEYWGTGEDYRLNLREVAWNGAFWQVRTVDTTPGGGKFNSMAMDSRGNPQIAYANVRAEHAGMRYAHWNGQAWEVEVLVGIKEPHPTYSESLALDKNDVPHIAYTDLVDNIVKYATKSDGKWILQPVDSLAEVAYPDRNGIALDDDGHPYISYYDPGQGVLKLAYRKDGRWVYEVVDQNFCGFTSSLRIANNTIWITYKDEVGQRLKFARRPLDSSVPVPPDPQARPGSAALRQ